MRPTTAVRVPVKQRHVAASDVLGNHSGEVDRVLGAAKLPRITQLSLLQVVDRRAHLQCHRQGTDPLVDTVLAKRLRAEKASVGFAVDHFHGDRFRARIVARVRIRIQVDLFVVVVANAFQLGEPASIIHNDYTARSGPLRLRDHFTEDPKQAEALLQRRFVIVNVWRSIRGTVLDAPLALCDAASLAPGDLVSVERQAKKRIGEIQQAVYNPAHRWYYFPEMGPDEALLIKTYDSATDGRARFTIHTSFDDPTAPAGAPPRESLETRCFAFF